MRLRLPLLPLCLFALGCDSLWAPYRGANSDHCAINPTICTSAQVCNSENGKCEDPSGLKLPHVNLPDCQLSTLLAALGMTDSQGFELVLPPGCTYQFTEPSSYLYGPSALQPITKPIAIDGNGAVFQGAGSATPFRFAYVAGAPPDFGSSGPGRLILRNLTLTSFAAAGGSGGQGGGGDASSPCGGGGGAGLGGALFVQGALELYGVTLIGNSATGGNGSGSSSATFDGGGGGGGGMGGDGASGTDNSVGGGGGGFRYPGCGDTKTNFDGYGGGYLHACNMSQAGEGGHGGDTDSAGGKGTTSTQGESVSSGSKGGSGGGSGLLGGAGGAAGGDASSSGPAGDGGGGGGGPMGAMSAPGGGGGGFAGGSGGSSFLYNTSSGGGGGGAFGGGGAGGTSFSGGGGGGIGGGGGGAGQAKDFTSTPAAGGGGGFGGGGGGGSLGGDGGFGGGGGSLGGSSRFGGGSAGLQSDSMQGSGGGLGAGGAIFLHQGSLIAANSSLLENRASGGMSGAGATPASGLGGAIFNLNGTVDLYNVTIAHNSTAVTGSATAARTEGGAIYNLSLSGSTPLTAKVTLRNSVLTDSQTGSPLSHDLYNDISNVKSVARVVADDSNWVSQADGVSSGSIPSRGPAGLTRVVEGGTVSYVPAADSALVGLGDPGICYDDKVGGVDQRGAHRRNQCTLGAIEASPLQGGCQASPAGRGSPTGILFAAVLAMLWLRRRASSCS